MHLLTRRAFNWLTPLICLWPFETISAASFFTQSNLVSDKSGVAAFTDPSLVNPWGVSFSATSPFWVSDQGANVSTLYSASGVKNTGLVVSTPGGPMGQVFNSTSQFLIGTTPSSFISRLYRET